MIIDETYTPPPVHQIPKNKEVFVFFYKGKGNYLDKLIRWWTMGPYSHCEIVTSDWVYSSTPSKGGVWQEAVTSLTSYPLDEWDMLKVNGDPDKVDEWFMSNWGKYDYLGVFGLALRPIPDDRKRFFCSEVVASSLGFKDGWRFDPNALYSALKPLTID